MQKGIREVEFSLKEIKNTSHFSQFINLSKLLKNINSLQRRAKHISVLDFKSGDGMSQKITKLKNTSFSQREELKSRLSFSISIENDFDKIVSTALEEILQNEGFIHSSSGELAFKGALKTSITKNNAGVFATPRLSIQIIDVKDNGKAIASYTKAYKKWGHINEEGATRKALIEVEKDLRQHFIEFFYSL